MKKITLIKMEGCPYCAAAYKAIKELGHTMAELEIIDENTQPQLAERFTDYYYVPSMYVDGVKVYEAQPGERYEQCLANVKKVFEAAQ